MSPAIRRRIRNRIGRGLTFEKVWATIERNAEEAEKRHAEWEAQRQKEAAEREAQRQKEAEEAEKRHAEWEAKWQKEAAEREAQRQREAAEREAQRQRKAEEAEKQHAEQEKEAAERQKEAEERKKEAAEREAKWQKKHEETERIVNEVSRQMGGLHNSFGEMAEFMVAPGIIDLFNDLGFHITQSAEHGIKILDEKKRLRAEIDLLIWNGDYIIAIEVKTSLGEKDIEKHRKRLEILREDINKTGDRRKIVGGMAVAVLNDNDRKAILDAGFYLLEPSEYSRMKMDLPEGFVPREW